MNAETRTQARSNIANVRGGQADLDVVLISSLMAISDGWEGVSGVAGTRSTRLAAPPDDCSALPCCESALAVSASAIAPAPSAPAGKMVVGVSLCFG